MVLVATAAAANGGNSRHTAGGRTYTEFLERQAVIYNGRFTKDIDVNGVVVYVGRVSLRILCYLISHLNKSELNVFNEYRVTSHSITEFSSTAMIEFVIFKIRLAYGREMCLKAPPLSKKK